MAINTNKLKQDLSKSLKAALDAGIPDAPPDASPDQLDVRAQIIDQLKITHASIADVFGTQAANAIVVFVEALGVALIKDLVANVPAGQDVVGMQNAGQAQAQKIGETSTSITANVPASDDAIGKLI
jgi:hypothetical protein